MLKVAQLLMMKQRHIIDHSILWNQKQTSQNKSALTMNLKVTEKKELEINVLLLQATGKVALTILIVIGFMMFLQARLLIHALIERVIG